MSAAKVDTLIEDTRILTKMNNRLNIIENTNTKLEIEQKEQHRVLDNQKKQQEEEIKRFKKESEKIKNQIHQLTKNIFSIGKQLKRKVSKDEINYLNKEIDDWPLEEYITRKEVEETYKHYAN